MKNESISSHSCLSYLIIVLFRAVGETNINVSAVLFALFKLIHTFLEGIFFLLSLLNLYLFTALYTEAS